MAETFILDGTQWTIDEEDAHGVGAYRTDCPTVRVSITRDRIALAVCRAYFDAYVAEKAASPSYCNGPIHHELARAFERAVYPERVR